MFYRKLTDHRDNGLVGETKGMSLQCHKCNVPEGIMLLSDSANRSFLLNLYEDNDVQSQSNFPGHFATFLESPFNGWNLF